MYLGDLMPDLTGLQAVDRNSGGGWGHGGQGVGGC